MNATNPTYERPRFGGVFHGDRKPQRIKKAVPEGTACINKMNDLKFLEACKTNLPVVIKANDVKSSRQCGNIE